MWNSSLLGTDCEARWWSHYCAFFNSLENWRCYQYIQRFNFARRCGIYRSALLEWCNPTRKTNFPVEVLVCCQQVRHWYTRSLSIFDHLWFFLLIEWRGNRQPATWVIIFVLNVDDTQDPDSTGNATWYKITIDAQAGEAVDEFTGWIFDLP